jgi:uncharacterized protein (TIGR00369 family)
MIDHTTPASRSRTITWEDPRRSAQAAPVMSGLEYLQAMFRGDLPSPPIMALLSIEAELAEEGRVVFAVTPAEFHYNPIGTVHGGLAATICDSALGCAVHSTLPAGAGYTTLELKVNFVRPVTVDTGRLRCEGRIIQVGGRVATAEARVTDARGTLYAHATTTCLVMRPEAER